MLLLVIYLVAVKVAITIADKYGYVFYEKNVQSDSKFVFRTPDTKMFLLYNRWLP